MTPEEVASYEAHEHDVTKYGKFAGRCCMAALDRIDEARKREQHAPTLFDLEAFA